MTTFAELADIYHRLNDECEALDQRIIALPLVEKDELLAKIPALLEQLYDVVRQLATIHGATLADIQVKAAIMLKLEAMSPDTMSLAWSIAEDLVRLPVNDPAQAPAW